MSCDSGTKSAIEEARDQLFLDTADDLRLDVVSSNLGMDRPVIGTNDPDWRALVKAIALQPKLVRNIFHRVIEIVIGPSKSRIGCISTTSEDGDTSVYLHDSTNLVQVGTLILDPGLPTEETVSFCFRDIKNSQVLFESPLAFDHTTLAEANSTLKTAAAATATSIVLVDSSLFPISGFPYSVILDRGKENEEIIQIASNNVSTGTLTCSALAYDHAAPTPTFLRKILASDAPEGRQFVTLNSTRNFPYTGFIRVNFGGGSAEVVEYKTNQVVDSVLILRRALVSAHLADESVELVNPGATVETVSVIQTGTGWEMFETTPRHIKIYIPAIISALRILDASWFHGAVASAASTTLASPATAGDTEIELTSSTTFPDEAGILLIDGTETAFYTLRDEDTDVLYLTQPLVGSFSAGDAVALVTTPYAGIDLDDGNLRNSSGVLLGNRFTGPYLYDINQLSPSLISSTLTTQVPAKARVVVSQIVGATSLEVDSAISWPTPPFDPFNIRVGYNSGFEETLQLLDCTLKEDGVTTVDTTVISGVTSIDGVDTTEFPESDGVNPARYQVRLGAGTINEEIVFVFDNAPGTPGTLTFISATINPHDAGETVEIINDILTFDPITQTHYGPTIEPSLLGHSVEAMQTQLSVTSTAGFLDSGTVLVNFGKERTNARSSIVSFPSAVEIELLDSSNFPTANYPYVIILGEGLPTPERAFVTDNDVGTNTLTISSALVGTFLPHNNVTYTAGTPTSVEYSSIDGNDLILESETSFEFGHHVGERVILSPGVSEPSVFGTDYGFYLPPDPSLMLKLMLELIRAAGVEVEFIVDK